MDSGAWAQAVLRGEKLSGVAIRRAETGELREVDQAARTITIVAGTSNLVRDHMRILVDGYDLSQYQRNPVVPWSHNYWDPPVAKCVDMRTENGSLICRDLFPPEGVYPFADMIFKMYSHPERFLRAASIGLNPLEHETQDDVLVITKSEVMEHSLCLIGVDPGCLTMARAAGIDVRPMDEWVRRCLDEDGHVVITRERAEAIVRTLGYGKGLALFSLDPAAIVALRAEKEPEPAAEIQEAEKPKPHRRDEDEEEPEAEGEPEEEQRAEAGEDEIVLVLEEDGEARAETEADAVEEEIEVDAEELGVVVQEALAAQLAVLLSQPPRVETR